MPTKAIGNHMNLSKALPTLHLKCDRTTSKMRSRSRTPLLGHFSFLTKAPDSD
ncbi:MAG: hypothetical protein F6K26_19130 [Moorea sp. SIO2I5]|nr:hypothetical protein [Moorena sp. SIO2I5]